jgi:hypothetical protein
MRLQEFVIVTPITVAARFSPAQTLGSWDRIPLEAWMSMCFYAMFVLCVGSGLATG